MCVAYWTSKEDIRPRLSYLLLHIASYLPSAAFLTNGLDPTLSISLFGLPWSMAEVCNNRLIDVPSGLRSKFDWSTAKQIWLLYRQLLGHSMQKVYSKVLIDCSRTLLHKFAHKQNGRHRRRGGLFANFICFIILLFISRPAALWRK